MNKRNMTDTEYLEMICKNCLKANGECIKKGIYIGLCAENDREELLELRKGKL